MSYTYTEHLSVNPWSTETAQDQVVEITIEVGTLAPIQGNVEEWINSVDEQDFSFISRYHAPINY